MTPALLIRYGRPGFVGRFASAVPAARGDRVVVRGPRGDEFGEVLLPLDGAGPDGTVLRGVTPADDAVAARLDAAAQQVLAAAGEGAAALGLPLAFVDVEATLDGVAVLHALPWDACDASPLLDDLAACSGLAVRLLDLSRAPAAGESHDRGCGKPGCGTGGGGCSSGGCSTCSRGTSADELTAHFADLRRRMEAAGMVRTPLN
jgi:hypothetical protein